MENNTELILSSVSGPLLGKYGQLSPFLFVECSVGSKSGVVAIVDSLRLQ